MLTLANQGELLSIDQLCERLFISPTTAYKLLQSGKIKAFKLGTRKIPEENVRKYIQEMCNN